jgi:hypothetical protein
MKIINYGVDFGGGVCYNRCKRNPLYSKPCGFSILKIRAEVLKML